MDEHRADGTLEVTVPSDPSQPIRPRPRRARDEPHGAVESVSVVLPAHDEEASVAPTVLAVFRALDGLGCAFEVIVVDDGSHDATAARAEAAGASVIRLPENRGYGAALVAGIRLARHPVVAILDADGTYPCSALPKLLEALEGHDMVIGARVGSDAAIPTLRRPAKWVLRKLAERVVGRAIPDLNSGMRVLRRGLVERFEHLLPRGFSFTTTITLASLCTGALVRFVPIDYRHRIGESKIRPTHAFDFLLLIVRTAVYFDPLKVFLPLGGVFFAVGLLKLVWDLRVGNVSETVLLGFLGASILWAVGLLSDQIARVALADRRTGRRDDGRRR